MALENNLGIQAERLAPQINTLNVVAGPRRLCAGAVLELPDPQQHAAAEQLRHRRQRSILTNESFSQNGGLQQNVPWGGGRYTFSLDGSKVTTSAIDSRYNPQLSSNLTAQYVQPLLRNFKTDSLRQQIETSRNNQVIADIGLREQVTVTTQAVRNAYFDLIGAIEGYKVSRQSLQLAQESLQEQPHQGRSRHAGADRHHRGGSGSREQRRSGHQRRGAHQDRRRSAALAGPEPVAARFLDAADRADRRAVADADCHRRRGRRSPTRSPTAPTSRGSRSSSTTSTSASASRENQRMPGLDVVANYNVIGVAGTQFVFGEGFPPPIVEPVARARSPTRCATSSARTSAPGAWR